MPNGRYAVDVWTCAPGCGMWDVVGLSTLETLVFRIVRERGAMEGCDKKIQFLYRIYLVIGRLRCDGCSMQDGCKL
jgi:hypothetical protein